MSYLIFAAGLLLAVCGAASISFGYGIINVERGWASVIGGASALSGGLITMALALILHSLSRLRAVLKAQGKRAVAATPAAVAEVPEDLVAQATAKEAPAAESAVADLTSAQTRVDDEHVTLVIPGPASAPATLAPPAVRQPAPAAPEPWAAGLEPGAQASIEDIRRVVAETIKGKRLETLGAEAGQRAAAELPAAEPLVKPPPSVGAELPPRRRAPPLSFHLPRAVGLNDLAPQGSTGAQTSVAPPLAGPEDMRQDSPHPAPEQVFAGASEPLRPDMPRKDPPVVLGRYESEGTTYVMFSDGSIEARSKRGAYRFNSMAELKSFMDAQARGEA
ncbi:conserved hypothetical protein [Methylocella silvestris BL2]|uniref:Uncharacterized protein n=1 Tax=Methylocella silvestris (strain DSM 15510 / CIP 108128 / LMG 27833 / NCIMB 13906 / BL2) TaxID=395965 RepID=B8EK83_METSB|nr:hypothetical protein [Methylocella silvestris]ACK50623.1 conserved hypothetical protein [Methylocella silvestris BL2]